MRLVRLLRNLALCALFFIPFSHRAHAATRIKASEVYSVLKNNVSFQCTRVKSKPLFVTRVRGKFLLGADAIKKLQPALSKKAKKKLKEMKTKVRAGNAACKNPDVATPTPTPIPIGNSTLEKLNRPLSRADVSYFLDKAAFGLSSHEETLVDIGINQGIDALVDALMTKRDEPSGLMSRVLDRLDGDLGIDTTQSPAGQREALLDLWLNTNNPYHEKFALFMLSVWTVGGDVISDETFRGAFWDYYQRLRDYAYANTALPDLGVAISRDPLMLIYLSNQLNVKGNPNENFARELMELFTLGPTDSDGNANYTETAANGQGDIAVAAKMLTGWKVTLNYQSEKLVASMQASRHQPGPHTMFAGKTYAFTGENDEDLIRGIFANHPQVRNYYAKEILKSYVTPDPPRALIESFGNVIHDRGYRLNEAMRVLLSSEAFFNPAFRDTVPMNSLEFATKTARLMELHGGVNPDYAEYQLRKMGMEFNMAPSVFWYNADVWSSPSVALEKANFIAEILSNQTAQEDIGWTPGKILPTGVANAQQVIEAARSRVGLNALSAAHANVLNGYMSQELQYDGVYTPFVYNNQNPDHQASKGLGCYYLLFLTSEFNLL